MVAICYSLLNHYYLLRYCEYIWQPWFPLSYALNIFTAIQQLTFLISAFLVWHLVRGKEQAMWFDSLALCCKDQVSPVEAFVTHAQAEICPFNGQLLVLPFLKQKGWEVAQHRCVCCGCLVRCIRCI